MGILASKFRKILLNFMDCKLVMLGLDGAGKTTLLYQLKLSEYLNTIPTVGKYYARLSLSLLVSNVKHCKMTWWNLILPYT